MEDLEVAGDLAAVEVEAGDTHRLVRGILQPEISVIKEMDC